MEQWSCYYIDRGQQHGAVATLQQVGPGKQQYQGLNKDANTAGCS